jgi:excinuclease ABC subunit A
VLDERRSGFTLRDTQRLIDILKSLRDLGNTVLSSSTTRIRFRRRIASLISGPGAGTPGGKLLFAGVSSDARGT